MHARVSRFASRIAAVSMLTLLPVVVSGQSGSPSRGTENESPSRVDIFVGFSYLAPNGTVQVPQAGGSPTPFSYNAVNVGVIASGAYYFNRYLGVQAEAAEHEYGDSVAGTNVGTKGNDDGFVTFAGGAILRLPSSDYVTPFAHGLIGGARVGGPDHNGPKWGPSLTVGGGLDFETPWFNHRLAIRLFEADYEYMHADFGEQVSPPGGRANIDAARLSGGLVIHVGSLAPPTPVTLACAANPVSVFPGEPVAVTATAGGLDPKDNVIYQWSGPGVTGNGPTAAVATDTLAPGSYTVQGTVKEGKPGSEGLKPWQTATSSASFTVKAFEPPTIGCSASPTTINPGDTATITATGVSPQNRPLTYSYSAAAGVVTGGGTTATFNSASAQPGAVDVTCNVADDKGHTVSSSTTVTIVAPPPPPAPTPEQTRLEARLALHSVFFPTAQPKAEHPEGGLVESQQTTLNTLATDFKSYLGIKPDAHLILTGHADIRGTAEYNQALSDRRVNRVKQFLVQQGVSEASIETRAVGKEQELSSDAVRGLVEQNPELTDADKARVLKRLSVIVLAQNRRVDISLSTTGQQSVQLYPFNATDAITLLNEKSVTPGKKAATKKP